MDDALQAHAAARARWAAQSRRCAICMTEIDDTLESSQLKQLPAAEQAAAYFTLALLDAGLAGHAPAGVVLLSWLVTERLTAPQAAWEAVALVGPRLTEQAYALIGASRPRLDSALRCTALQILATHLLELEAWALVCVAADVLYRLHLHLATESCSLPAPLGAT